MVFQAGKERADDVRALGSRCGRSASSRAGRRTAPPARQPSARVPGQAKGQVDPLHGLVRGTNTSCPSASSARHAHPGDGHQPRGMVMVQGAEGRVEGDAHGPLRVLSGCGTVRPVPDELLVVEDLADPFPGRGMIRSRSAWSVTMRFRVRPVLPAAWRRPAAPSARARPVPGCPRPGCR
jgi:hypothetical protein